MRKIAALRRLSWSRRLLLLEALGLLGLARCTVLLVPFRRVAPLLGSTQSETSQVDDADAQAVVTAVGWAIRVVSPRTPWQSNCLAQAIAAMLMLRRRAVTSTLYLGVLKRDEQVQAHAWLRTGGTIVTGGQVPAGFTVIASFGGPAPRRLLRRPSG